MKALYLVCGARRPQLTRNPFYESDGQGHTFVAADCEAVLLSAKGDTVASKRFDVAYNRYLIRRITLDNLFIAQNEQDQARTQYVQALRRYWQAYYTLRRVTLFDFETNQVIR